MCAISPPAMYSRQLQECWQNQASVGENYTVLVSVKLASGGYTLHDLL